MTPGEKHLRETLAAMYTEGCRTVAANEVAERLWPEGRTNNTNGQVFHLGAATASRMLRKSPAAFEYEFRRWEIVPEYLSQYLEDLNNGSL